jgi:hypothetical protein
MRVQTFLGKVNMESLRVMDEQINDWLTHNSITPSHITQAMGVEIVGDKSNAEPVVITSIWYEGID